MCEDEVNNHKKIKIVKKKSVHFAQKSNCGKMLKNVINYTKSKEFVTIQSHALSLLENSCRDLKISDEMLIGRMLMDNFIDKLAQKFTAGEVIKANSAAEERELKRLREQVAEYERCLQEMRQVQMINTQTAKQLHDLMVESTDSIHKLTAESTEAFQKLITESRDSYQSLITESTEEYRNLTKESAEEYQKLTAESTGQYQKLTEECTDNYRKLAEESVENLQKCTQENSEAYQKLAEESLAKITAIQVETDAQKAESKKSLLAAVMTMEKMEGKVAEMQKTVAELTEALEKNQQEVAEWFKQADDFLHKENVKVYRNVQAVIVDEVGNKAETIMKAQEETVKKSNKPVFIFAVLGAAAAVANLVIQILGMAGM